ncbi:MAG: primosomal protein N', partial [Desulfobacterales bacterium]|nr:primosomal protein N' [Desulfobacterales bacterium]
GARSAIFAPFARLGLVVVDEEHDGSYKQEQSLRYNARDLAVVRAKLQGGIALLGSATPSIQSYYNVTRKKFVELSLHQRVEKRPLPQIQVVDLRESRDQRGIRRFISPELSSAMAETLARGEQVLLFLNRRGFAGLPLCASCGEALRCQNCDISMTLHRGAETYKCHYCGFRLPAAAACRHCGSGKIQLLGLGTEKVESAVTALFPEARVARMDRDTTTAKGSLLRILKALRSHAVDILIGTQMVAKGHDFPLITLVGIICADLSLNFPDFRAGERTFQLLAQVAGRAGRGQTEGRVILQTYAPDHFSIQAARDQDFKPFYEKEIVFRKTLKYPPFSRLIHIGISGRQKTPPACHAQTLREALAALQRSDRSFAAAVEILGPVEAPLPRIDRHYRWQLLLKGAPVPPLQRMIRRFMRENIPLLQTPRFKVVIDVDPYTML